MARAKTTLKDLKPKPTKPDVNIICTKCGIEKKAKDDFYMSYNSRLSIAPFCKECVINESLTEDGSSIDIEKFQSVLQQLDRPYLNQIYIASIKEGEGNPRRVIGFYMKNVSTPQYRVLRFAHSDFGHLEKEAESQQKVEAPKKETTKKSKEKLSIKNRNDLKDKWGEYTDSELLRFEKKYQQMSKSYQILTTLHEEGLIDFCRLQCLYEMAVEKKDMQEAKIFKSLADDAKKNAKLNPLQLDKADLTAGGCNSFGEIARIVSDMQEAKIFKSLADDAKKNAKLNPLQLDKADLTAGGCNSFGEIARIVSKRDGVCKLPLKFLRQPNDYIDYAIYQFIAYERALRGLPEPEYEDIYRWYLDDIKKYEEKYGVEFNEEPKYIQDEF